MIADQFTEEEFKAFYQRLRNYIEAEKAVEAIELTGAEREAERRRCDARIKELLVGMEQRIADAYTTERERCAKLCEDMADRHVVTEVFKRDALREAAAAIRKGE